jgi:hypothetical protein
MRLPRTFIIAAAIAVTALATVGFGGPLSDRGHREDAAARHNIALAALTADATPLSHGVLPPLGPIPCPDGSTVDFGQFCPVPTVQCADGTSVFIGQFCPVFKPQQPTSTAQAPPPVQAQKPLPTPQGPPTPLPPATKTCTDGTVVNADSRCLSKYQRAQHDRGYPHR